MNDLKQDRHGWGTALTLATLFHLALLGLMTGMHAVSPQRTQLAAVRIAFLPEAESAPPAQQPALPTPQPRPLPETPAPLRTETTPAIPEQQPAAAPAVTAPPTLDIQPLHRLSQAPQFLQRIDPEYPEAERASGRQANLVVEVVVDTRGRVLQASIVKSGGANFDQAALNAVKQSLFLPGYIGGQSVVVRFQIPFRFQLR